MRVASTAGSADCPFFVTLERCQNDLRKAEVQKFYAALGHENVRGLEVAMNDALLVGSVEGIANLHRIIKSLGDTQRTSERGTFDVLHDQVVRPDIMQGANVRMIQRGHGVRFALEAFGEPFVRNLDRDHAIQPCIASFVDLTHPSSAKERDDFIRPQSSCGCQRHWNPPIVPFEIWIVVDYGQRGSHSGPKSASGRSLISYKPV